MTHEEIIEALRLCEAASPGPWVLTRLSGQPFILSAPDPTNPRAGTVVVMFEPCQKRDAELIAMARLLLPQLLRTLLSAEIDWERRCRFLARKASLCHGDTDDDWTIHFSAPAMGRFFLTENDCVETVFFDAIDAALKIKQPLPLDEATA